MLKIRVRTRIKLSSENLMDTRWVVLEITEEDSEKVTRIGLLFLNVFQDMFIVSERMFYFRCC